FSEGFEEEKFNILDVEEHPSGTIFQMSGYTLQKIAKGDFIHPKKLKHRILEEFYARLFQLKKDGVSIKISIQATVEGKQSNESIDNSDIPEFTMLELGSSINLIDKFDLHYSIKEVEPSESSLIAAITVDERT